MCFLFDSKERNNNKEKNKTTTWVTTIKHRFQILEVTLEHSKVVVMIIVLIKNYAHYNILNTKLIELHKLRDQMDTLSVRQ